MLDRLCGADMYLVPKTDSYIADMTNCLGKMDELANKLKLVCAQS